MTGIQCKARNQQGHFLKFEFLQCTYDGVTIFFPLNESNQNLRLFFPPITMTKI